VIAGARGAVAQACLGQLRGGQDRRERGAQRESRAVVDPLSLVAHARGLAVLKWVSALQSTVPFTVTVAARALP
jgi:hypothetical protein